MIESKENGKTVYRIEKKDMSVYDNRSGKDLTTGGAKLISNSDIPEEKWNKIFKGEK